MPFQDHPLRYRLANELHARPFPTLEAPCHAVFVAIQPLNDAASRPAGADRAHLAALLDRYGAAHPAPEGTHFFGQIGRHMLKWESHTEFVTYTGFTPGIEARPFDPVTFDLFPPDWLAVAPGACATSALVRVDLIPDDESRIDAALADWFEPESLACSRVVDGAAIIASDFRIDPAGHMRFAMFVRAGTNPQRIGRIVQRLCEIETYKAMSMLGLAQARDLSATLAAIDQRLTHLVAGIGQQQQSADDTLDELLQVSADLETLLVQTSFRFGATGAYEALVNQRIAAIREQRFNGRQTFAEFMMRRFDPAMRTVKSAESRLQSMAVRAARAGELLRTRVDVERSAQNQKLLESMDRRADLQLRLQRTVEGLSVVAISYYAVNLTAYVLAPVAEPLGLGKTAEMALLTPVVVMLVWLLVARIRAGAGEAGGHRISGTH